MTVPKSFCFGVDKSDYTLAKFTGDNGLVFPLVYNDLVNGVSITPFQKVPLQTQERIVDSVLEEWGQVANLDNLQSTLKYILDNWTHAYDMFYVYTVNDTPIGFVGVDQKNWLPYMSHLYVFPEHRGKGHATFLIEFCKQYTKYARHNEYRLYCDRSMIPFYKKHGFEVTRIDHGGDPELVIMQRNLAPTLKLVKKELLY